MNNQARVAEGQYALYLSRDKTAEQLRELNKYADTPRLRRIMRLALSLKREMNRVA